MGVRADRYVKGELVQSLDFKQGQQEPNPHVWGDAENAIAWV